MFVAEPLHEKDFELASLTLQDLRPNLKKVVNICLKEKEKRRRKELGYTHIIIHQIKDCQYGQW